MLTNEKENIQSNFTRQMLTASMDEPENACMHARMREKSCGHVILDTQVACNTLSFKISLPFLLAFLFLYAVDTVLYGA